MYNEGYFIKKKITDLEKGKEKDQGHGLGEGGLVYTKRFKKVMISNEGKGWNGNFIEINKIINDMDKVN